MLQFIIRNSLVAIQLPLTREARILCGARDYCSFAMVVRMTVFGATGGASKARMPEMNAQRLCTDAKPTERS